MPNTWIQTEDSHSGIHCRQQPRNHNTGEYPRQTTTSTLFGTWMLSLMSSAIFFAAGDPRHRLRCRKNSSTTTEKSHWEEKEILVAWMVVAFWSFGHPRPSSLRNSATRTHRFSLASSSTHMVGGMCFSRVKINIKYRQTQPWLASSLSCGRVLPEASRSASRFISSNSSSAGTPRYSAIREGTMEYCGIVCNREVVCWCMPRNTDWNPKWVLPFFRKYRRNTSFLQRCAESSVNRHLGTWFVVVSRQSTPPVSSNRNSNTSHRPHRVAITTAESCRVVVVVALT